MVRGNRNRYLSFLDIISEKLVVGKLCDKINILIEFNTLIYPRHILNVFVGVDCNKNPLL